MNDELPKVGRPRENRIRLSGNVLPKTNTRILAMVDKERPEKSTVGKIIDELVERKGEK